MLYVYHMQVGKEWTVDLQCEAFVAIRCAEPSQLNGLTASLQNLCIQITIMTMKRLPNTADAKLALQVSIDILPYFPQRQSSIPGQDLQK
jgi:hypothetical protein